jgi:uncharacterized OB-fold protein
MLEARCTKCGETFNPHSEDPDDLEHFQTADEVECGGTGVVVGEWVYSR